ncbi:hypothetical protein [Acidianus sp. RZ1]|uniref:hypothetical protein n=1 Tax=Acidianus sp. RZ1 TaxID=1540082 RepID=UPI001491E627|nr:hypothetical protein [Acidianus sp. RZ1]NON61463.1 hypothetical protein [Acidianus sp. RZ1]
MSISLLDFETESIKVGVYLSRTNDENLKIRVFIIPTHLIKRDDHYSVMFNTIVTTDSDKIKPGEMCNPQNILSHKGKVLENMEVVSKPETIIRADDRRIIISLELTSVVVYPELRDPSGSPCVVASWIYFQDVK